MVGHGIANNPGGYDKNDDPSYCVYEAHSSRPYSVRNAQRDLLDFNPQDGMLLLSLGAVGLPNVSKATVRSQHSGYQLEPQRGRK